MKDSEAESDEVRGERGSSALTHAPSLQSRMSNILAIGLMSVLGLGLLTWYYANALTRQSHARQSAQAVSAKRAQGDMPLPSLGRINPPAVERPASPPPAPPVLEGTASSAPMTVPTHDIPLQPLPPANMYGTAPPKTPTELALERQLSGAVFSSQSSLCAAQNGAFPPGSSVPAAEPGELSTL